MDIARPEAKLREVKFFLGKMRYVERHPLADQEPFMFYMNALLCAASSLRDCFRHGQDKGANAWKKHWKANNLTPSERALYRFLGKDRDAEVHRAGSRRKLKTKEQWLRPGSYSLTPGTREDVIAPPDLKEAVKISPQAYVIDIDGTERVAIEACAKYAALLERLVAEYKATHPGA